MVDFPLKYVDYSHYAFEEDLPMPEEGDISTYWTGIPSSTSFPDVPYEILEEMYVPDEDAYFQNEPDNEDPTALGRISNKEDLAAHIYSLAFIQSGNGSSLPPNVLIPDPDTGTQVEFLGISFRGKWTPRGFIAVWDDIAGSTTTTTRRIIGYEYYDCPPDYSISTAPVYDDYQEGEEYGSGSSPQADSGSADDGGLELEPIESTRRCRRPIYQTSSNTANGGLVPLVGAQILVRDTFTLSNEITNSAGYFQFRRFRVALRHHIQWERKQYSIRDGYVAQAMLRGPKIRKQLWNVAIFGGEDQIHADIHRAAHMYYYQNIAGLSSPPQNTTWRWQMKLCALEHLTFVASNHVPFRRFIGLGQIWMNVDGKDQQERIGLTFHELAHAVHWKVTPTSYNDMVWRGYIDQTSSSAVRVRNKRLIESWGVHIEITYTNEFYRRLGEPNYQYFDNRQRRTLAQEHLYTTGIFDLTDDFNQSQSFNGTPIDNAEGFSLLQLEFGLKNTDHWDEYGAKMANLGVDNPADVFQLFNNAW